MNMAGQKILVLNTKKVAADLLDRRGSIYSSRPRFISTSCHQCLSIIPQLSLCGSVASEIFSRGPMIFFAQFGETCVQASSALALMACYLC